jgi:hypothetical protein
VIHEHGETWWNDISRRKLLICPLELYGESTNSFIVARQEKLAKEMLNFVSQSISAILQRVLAIKSYNIGLTTLLLLQRKVCCVDFYCPWPGLNLRISGPVASMLTTKPLTTSQVMRLNTNICHENRFFIQVHPTLSVQNAYEY